MRTLIAIAALVASLEVYAGHWADQNGQCLDEGGEPTACKWGQMYWGDGQTYSPPIVAPQVDANSDGSEDIRITLLNLMQGSQNGWSAVTYFRVECDGLPVQIISADKPRLTGLEPETTYSCLIYAGNDLGLGDQAGQFTVTTDAESGGGLPVWVIWAALNPTDRYELYSGDVQGVDLDLSDQYSVIMTGTNGHGITTDGRYLYACGSPIQRLNLATEQIDLLEGSSCTYDLKTDGTHLYYVDSHTTIKRRNLATGVVETLTSTPNSNGISLDTDSNSLYVWNRTSDSFIYDLASGNSSSIALDDFLRVAMTPNHFYLGPPDGLMEVRRDDPSFNYRKLIDGRMSGVSTDGSNIFFTIANSNGVYMTSTTNPSRQTLLNIPNEDFLVGVTTDGWHLYVAGRSTRNVYKILSNLENDPITDRSAL
jgi:DNA-binding beta-propeller fold protein YncE